jgi:hypothetical protein
MLAFWVKWGLWDQQLQMVPLVDPFLRGIFAVGHIA